MALNRAEQEWPGGMVETVTANCEECGVAIPIECSRCDACTPQQFDTCDCAGESWQR